MVMFIKRLSADRVAIGAPAKINLDLRVLGRRTDGYHDIDSLFQAVSLFDRLKFRRLDESADIRISLARQSNLATDESNLVARAFRLMQSRFRLSGGLEVELEKNIPVAAGLGGGSSDGAAAILACKALFGLPLGTAEMAALGAEIGSDLPFFFSSGQAHVTGRGEIVEDIELPLDYWLVLVTLPMAVSTARAYADLRLPLTRDVRPRSFRGWKVPRDIVKWLSDTGNDFEPVQLRAFPHLQQVKNGLADSGALLTRMSGSGPTVFGIYGNAPDMEGDRVLGRSDWTVSVARPIRLPARL
ncbi:MAG: 4-(cytidine 5'-diphospho)-2-C-methyl-D-erythritol kinase [Candidatus Zixiibacteriota bacterium]